MKKHQANSWNMYEKSKVEKLGDELVIATARKQVSTEIFWISTSLLDSSFSEKLSGISHPLRKLADCSS